MRLIDRVRTNIPTLINFCFSPFFFARPKTTTKTQTLLSQQYDKHPIFILKDVKFQELRAMMDYMYRGEVNISQDQLAALLKAAESLQIKGLSDSRSGGPMPSSHKSDGKSSHVPAPKVSFATIMSCLAVCCHAKDSLVVFFVAFISFDARRRQRKKNVQQTMNSSFLSYYNNDY